jgi:hypothetical protein
MLALLWWLEKCPHAKGGSAWAKCENSFHQCFSCKKIMFIFFNINFLKVLSFGLGSIIECEIHSFNYFFDDVDGRIQDFHIWKGAK